MANILSYNRNITSVSSGGEAIPLPPNTGRGITAIVLDVPQVPNTVELIATVGVQGTVGVGSLVFSILRAGIEIYNARVDLSSDFPQFSLITLQAIDVNVGVGAYGYQLAVTNVTEDFEATLIGPVNFSGKVIDA